MLQATRVVLREIVRSDVDEMAKWPRYTEAELQWANFDERSTAERDLWFEIGRSDLTRCRFAILNQEGCLIGILGLRHINLLPGQATLGIQLAANEVNKGYGTEAIITLLHIAFEQMNLKRINLDVVESNKRARRCYEKCGFNIIGRHLDSNGDTYIDMSISREEF
ncbi:MAG: GNAT family N-acetyltransferase [Chloroflexi bacterium]|nr:GNAT family N-acetyltransferase [Chloroflexota bacterium]MCL5075036.1 GNAT family N-acetyltransferase [Chloroflexota bacterium]